MLLETKQITAIIDLISENAQPHAVTCWKTAQGEGKRCDACFYVPLAKKVRCASCLEGHLTQAVMSFVYPRINQNALEHAERSLKSWVKANQEN